MACKKCVGYCQESFCVTNSNNQTFCVNQFERLDMILQKMALFIKDPACWNTNIAHIFTGTITNNSVELFWQGVPLNVASINVYYATSVGPYTLANATPLVADTLNL